MSERIVKLDSSLVESCMALSHAAGWNQTARDWERVVLLEPEGCFGMECDGTLAASAATICYGTDVAWIGMVLTGPAFRGRGFARRLMEHSMEYLHQRGIAWMKLDATSMGIPLYAKLGFEEECAIERWRRPAAAAAPTSPDVNPLCIDGALDRQAFGADRRFLLDMLAREGDQASFGGAYALGRPGAVASFFGPCVGPDPASARALLQWYLRKHAGEAVFWDLLPGNEAACRIARDFDFEPVRRLVRMARRGKPDAAPIIDDCTSVFATAGFEYG